MSTAQKPWLYSQLAQLSRHKSRLSATSDDGIAPRLPFSCYLRRGVLLLLALLLLWLWLAAGRSGLMVPFPLSRWPLVFR
jgi:hypothetical protein